MSTKKTKLEIVFIPEGCEEMTVDRPPDNDIESLSVFTLEERLKGGKISAYDIQHFVNLQRARIAEKPRCPGCRRLLEAIIKDAALLEFLLDFNF
jgi:hypothetical protein